MDKLPNYASRKFLLVDDESFMLGRIDRVLKQCQAGRILRAPNGARALDLFRSSATQVDCIIADLNMKPMNGLELLQAVRTGVNKKIPRDQRFIMLTGHGERAKVLEAVEIGINEFLLKPVSTKSLRDRLASVLFHPRPMIRSGDYYGPVPRRFADIQRENDDASTLVFLN